VTEDVEGDEAEPKLRFLPFGRPALGAWKATGGHRGAQQQVFEVSAVLELKKPLTAFRNGLEMGLKPVGYVLPKFEHARIAVFGIAQPKRQILGASNLGATSAPSGTIQSLNGNVTQTAPNNVPPAQLAGLWLIKT